MMIVTPSKDNQTDGEVWYGMTRWYIDDVKYLAPEWTDEQCHEFMERHDRHFKDRMIELGWEVLDLYVAQEKHLLTIRKGAKIRAMPHIEEGKNNEL
jgi:hypothetical protein